jgi:hypothetical protein
MALISDTRVRGIGQFTSTVEGNVYTIHLIDDDFSPSAPIEESDFSSGVDSWTVPNSDDSVTQLSSFDGVSNVLEFNSPTSSTGTHSARKNVGLVDGTEYRVTAKIYIPSANTTLKRVHVDNGFDTFGYIDAVDQWVDISIDFTGSTNPRFFFSGSTDSDTFNFTSTVDDKFYIADVVITDVDSIPLELKLDRDGFTLEHGHGDDMKHVLGSSFSMGVMITGEDTETLAEDMMSLQEDRFGVRVYENEELKWFGTVYQDGVQVDLQHQPYIFRVTAYDGLAKMKEIASGSPWLNSETPRNFASMLVKMLKYVDSLDLSNGTQFMRSAVDLRSDEHRAYNTQFDTLAECSVGNYDAIFYKAWDGRGQIFEGRKWYDILERVMFAFHSQIRLTDGCYEIVPFTKMYSTSSSQVREFDRDYFELDTNTGDPRTFTGVAYSTKTYGSGWTNDKLQGMSVGFEQAAERIVIKEELGKAIPNRDVDLDNNAATANFVTSDSGFIDISFDTGVFPLENQLATDKECWVELRAYITTVYNSQTYYWGPYRETTAGSNFGEVISWPRAWSTTERWETVGRANYFDTLKFGASPYPDFSTAGAWGALTANELRVVRQAFSSQKDILGSYGNNGPLIPNIYHPSGSKGTITVQLKLVALEKSDNTITSDVDTDTITLTQAQLVSFGLGNYKQGATVRTFTNIMSKVFTHSIDTGQIGLSTLVKEIGDLHFTDNRANHPPSEIHAYNGTDFADNWTEYWTDGTGTPDTPLMTYLLRQYAQIYQKPVKRPDVAFVDSMNVQGRVISVGTGFPLSAVGDLTQYIPVQSKFIARDNVLEQTWLEYDGQAVTNDPIVDLPSGLEERTFPDAGESWVDDDRDDNDDGILPGTLDQELEP